MSARSLGSIQLEKADLEIEQEVVPPSYQFRALARKNVSYQSRQWCTNCCQISVPFILVIVAGLFQILFNHYVIDAFTSGNQIMTNPNLMVLNNGSYTPSGNYTYRWEYYWMWHTEDQWTPEIGNLTQTGGKQGMLGQITQLVNTTDTSPETTYSPWYEFIEDEDTMINTLYEQKSYWVERQLANQRYPRCYTCPESANIFNQVTFATNPNETSVLDYEILVDTQMGYDQLELLHTVMNFVDTAFIRQASGNSNWTILTWVQPLPYIEQAPTFDIGSFLGVILYPFAVSFVMAVYVNTIVVEKQERLREMMRMMGLQMMWYWWVNYLWDIFLYALVISIMVLTSIAFRLRMFTQTAWLLWAVILVGWGNSQVALSFTLSTFFNKARTATIVAYLLVIAGVICSYVLNATVFAEDSSSPAIYTIFFLYPPFACYRAIYLIGVGCSFYECPQLDSIEFGGEMFYIMVFLILDGFLYFPLALYLDAVMPREYGVTKHPLFPLFAIRDYIKQKRAKSVTEVKPLLIPTGGAPDQLDEIPDDKDVADEAARIREQRIPSTSPIVIVNFRKVYKSKPGTPEKIAVHGLYLHVEKGECFGLLGPNGAGKTTTISVLTGLFPPTSGNAFIGGYSILDDIDAIHRIMSVCPQFDTLWMDLTCRETLLFYARLKGIKPSEEKEHVKDILEKVGLFQYANRKAKDLSGGMRRRLSIGISLVGDPKVVFLDEPTTGLDPETRRHLWDVLLEVKKGRCMILTTHSMEEADILCSRIGIMSKGRMQCLGNQLHLKNKFGEGYTIHVTYLQQYQQRVHEYMEELIPDATLMETFAGNSIYQIKREHLVVSQFFATMEETKREHGIQDWGISQTTLEDVFIRIVRRDESEAEMEQALNAS